uniref:Uncharacterized protein n=1 Tax=Macaca nemestrina TaxID=9545 RepID=A0A2K6ASB0_MACNE
MCGPCLRVPHCLYHYNTTGSRCSYRPACSRSAEMKVRSYKSILWSHLTTNSKQEGGQSQTRLKTTMSGLLVFLLHMDGTNMEECILTLPAQENSTWRRGPGVSTLP